jgi:hypothetical protein
MKWYPFGLHNASALNLHEVCEYVLCLQSHDTCFISSHQFSSIQQRPPKYSIVTLQPSPQNLSHKLFYRCFDVSDDEDLTKQCHAQYNTDGRYGFYPLSRRRGHGFSASLGTWPCRDRLGLNNLTHTYSLSPKKLQAAPSN